MSIGINAIPKGQLVKELILAKAKLVGMRSDLLQTVAELHALHQQALWSQNMLRQKGIMMSDLGLDADAMPDEATFESLDTATRAIATLANTLGDLTESSAFSIELPGKDESH